MALFLQIFVIMSRALYISNYTLLVKNVKRFLHFIFNFSNEHRYILSYDSPYSY